MSVDKTVGSFADPQSFECLMEKGQLIFGQSVGDVAQLVRIDAHVVISDESRDEFTVERIVRRVESADAPVRVVVGVHADTKWAVVTQRCRPPMISVVTEAIHLLIVALAIVRLDHGSFAAQFLLTSLLSFLFDLATISLTN